MTPILFAATVFQNITDQLGLMVFTDFAAGWVVAVFLYIITIGIGFFGKMSIDGFVVTITIATFINAIWFFHTDILISLLFIGAGILMALAIMRLIRH